MAQDTSAGCGLRTPAIDGGRYNIDLVLSLNMFRETEENTEIPKDDTSQDSN
jgi:hypothetical protein